MTGDPTVTIVTPSYNQGAYLEDTLVSVGGQTYAKIEHIVMDGGSTDDSLRIIQRHASRLAHWQSARDGGFAHAIADGFARSSGEILAWLNSDDLLAPTAVAQAVNYLREHPDVVMVYGNRICIDAQGLLLYMRPSPPIGGGSPFSHTILPQESCFWRRRVYDQVGGLNRDLRHAIDYDLFSRFARVGRVAHCGRIWGYFRKHGESKTMTEYLTLGRSELTRIQREVWQRAPSRADRWAQAGTRAYALLLGGVFELAAVPRELTMPPRAPLRERLGASLAQPPWIIRAARRLKLL